MENKGPLNKAQGEMKNNMSEPSPSPSPTGHKSPSPSSNGHVMSQPDKNENDPVVRLKPPPEKQEETKNKDSEQVNSKKRKQSSEYKHKKRVKAPTVINYGDSLDTQSDNWEHLFSKKLTRSDTDPKPSRLCIPRRWAEHFLQDATHPKADINESTPMETVQQCDSPLSVKPLMARMDMQVVDDKGRVWRFEYRFVYKTKDSNLRLDWGELLRTYKPSIGDEVSFYRHKETRNMGLKITHC